jgi:Tol biopolymer transport system component
MAISLGRHFVEDWVSDGRLARVALSGSAPREILESVVAADWSPDGANLAIVRDVAGRNRLEYPVGRVLYETAGWVSHPRVSREGDRVAFLDHPVRGRDAGAVALADRAGTKTTLSSGWANEQGLAWSPNGEEVWFTASTVGFSRDLHAVTTSGRTRMVARLGDNLTLQDTARDGRALIARDRVRARMVGLLPGESTERDLDWLDVSLVADLSPDGKLLLFEELGAAAGTAPAVYVRRTDGSPAVRLGEGYALALSRDGRWALASHLVRPQLLLLPTGAGEPKILTRGSITDYQWATFFPDGQRILAAANEPNHGVRLYVQDLVGGAPRAISTEGVNAILGGILVSPDAKLAAAIGPTRTIVLYPLEGGPPRPVPGVAEGEVPLQWSPDGGSLYLFRRGELPVRVFKLDIATGRREIWKQLMPSDPAGVNIILSIRMTPDATSYAYSYGQGLSQLDLVEGLR